MRNEPEYPVIYLMGPTASGKTALALELHKRLPIEIVSVDSAMVYRGLDIGTAKPSLAEQKTAPHRLIDICEPTENYSAGQFCRDALSAIEEIHSNNKIPLLVGGTGLYFRSLEQGFSTLPSTDEAIREKVSALMQELGPGHAHAKLAEIDPASAQRIHPNDPQRIQRALEVYEITGKPLSELMAEGRHAQLASNPIKFVLAPSDRAVLHTAVEARFDQMLELGLVDEVDKFYRRNDMHAELSSMRLIGYRQVWRYLAGDSPYQEMREHAIVATRQLVKRQLTWFRAEADLTWLEAENTAVIDKFLAKVDKYPAFSATL